MVATKISQLVAIATLIASAIAAPRVDPGVHRTLRRQATVNLMVSFKQDTTAPLNSVQEASFDSRGAKIEALVEKLQAHASSSQADVAKMIRQESSTATAPLFSKAETFWISNEMYFENASFELVEKLASLPSVKEIREEETLTVAINGDGAPVNATTTASVEWGVAMIKAPEVWAMGNTGQGVVVGGIDSGVRATHEIFRGNFRTSYGWFDAVGGAATPSDSGGHGSLTLGSAVGANGVGVAPGASWIACRACSSFCQESAIKSCMQFMTCPTDPSGKNKDCSKAPNVVNNSWGGPGGSNTYDAMLKAWSTAGIIPVFANGNFGTSGCKTTFSPGDSPLAIAVGATTSSDALGTFSGKGPSEAGLIKPDITAPGVQIRSASHTGDDVYRTVDGTSHASPHVAGVVALMLSANPKLSFTQIRSILTTTTDQTTLQPSGYTCGGTADKLFPNNQYGHGRVNALKAVLKAASTTV